MSRSRFPNVSAPQSLSIQSVQGSVQENIMDDETESDQTRRSPAFHIADPNILTGSKTHVIFNAEMCLSLCELIENLDPEQHQGHLWALAKKLRTHHWKMRQLFEARNLQEGVDSRSNGG